MLKTAQKTNKNDVDSNQLKENKEEINHRIDELCKNIEEKEFIVRKEKIKLKVLTAEFKKKKDQQTETTEESEIPVVTE